MKKERENEKKNEIILNSRVKKDKMAERTGKDVEKKKQKIT